MDCVGTILAEERRKRGRTLADVEGATRIRTRLLEALEHGRYDELPPAAYVKGYIQSYAEYLRLPAQPLVQRYEGETRAECEPLVLQVPKQVVPRREHSHGMPVRSLVYLASAAMLVGLAGWGGYRYFTRPVQPPPLPGSGTAHETGEKKRSRPQTETSPAIAMPRAAADALPGPQYLLKIRIVDGQASWLRVIVDGRKVFEGMMQGGQEQKFTVTQAAKLRIGKTPAVQVTKDGQAVALKQGAIVSTLDVPASE